MSQFFFHLSIGGDRTIRDNEGTAFPSSAQAIEHAEAIAAELRRGRREITQAELVVLDDTDREVCRIRLRDG